MVSLGATAAQFSVVMVDGGWNEVEIGSFSHEHDCVTVMLQRHRHNLGDSLSLRLCLWLQ